MDNIGDWLYIVIIAVAGLSSMLSAGKKKKQQQEAQNQKPPQDIVTPETASDRSFWDTLTQPEDEWQSKQESVIISKPIKKKKQPKQQKVTSTPQPFLKGESEIERMIRQQEKLLVSPSKEEKPLVSVSDFQNPDSLKKAVIYSEILNRKY